MSPTTALPTPQSTDVEALAADEARSIKTDMTARHLAFEAAYGTLAALDGWLNPTASDVAALRLIATTDPMTGALTREYGLTRVDTGDVIALLDLDGFKPVNDTHGHAAGDQVLAAVVDRLRRVDPGPALTLKSVVRLGGDEFLVVLTYIEAAPFGDAAQTIVRRAIEAAPFAVNEGSAPMSIGASVGCAFVTETGVVSALACADERMYEDKLSRKSQTRRQFRDRSQGGVV